MGTQIIIQQGQPQTATQTLELYPINSTGDPDACRRLVHPNTSIPPLVYSVNSLCFNPVRTRGFDLDVLLSRQTSTVKTLGSTRVIDYTDQLEDSIVTEEWPGSESDFSMPIAMWRELYVYYRNPPDTTVGEYVVWEPRDRTSKRYNVQILSITPTEEFQIDEFRSRGGGGDSATVTSILEPTASGFINSTVALRMRIVGEVL